MAAKTHRAVCGYGSVAVSTEVGREGDERTRWGEEKLMSKEGKEERRKRKRN